MSKRFLVTITFQFLELCPGFLMDLYCVWSTVEPGCNDIGLDDTSPIAWDFLWYQSVPHC